MYFLFLFSFIQIFKEFLIIFNFLASEKNIVLEFLGNFRGVILKHTSSNLFLMYLACVFML